jgi:hypothetical protein
MAAVSETTISAEYCGFEWGDFGALKEGDTSYEGHFSSDSVCAAEILFQLMFPIARDESMTEGAVFCPILDPAMDPLKEAGSED